jgi:hypothetical protein
MWDYIDEGPPTKQCATLRTDNEGRDMTETTTNPTVMAATYLKQWMLDPNHHHHSLLAKAAFSGPADRNYNLKNSQTRKFLQWEEQTFGVNLGWTDDASPQTATRVSRWFFTRPSSDQSPLRYGEPLALGYGIDPSYIHYANRTVGINIEWSQAPRFEWKLLGGAGGDPARSGDWLAIYNEKANDCLMYFDRTVGGDIGWPSSETWADQIADIVLQAIKDHWKEGVAYLLAA